MSDKGSVPEWALHAATCCGPYPAYSTVPFTFSDNCGRGCVASNPVRKPEEAGNNGKVLLDRRKPFELFLKLGGGIFAVHFQVGRLAVTYDVSAGKRRRALRSR